jgi:hypothetical protein
MTRLSDWLRDVLLAPAELPRRRPAHEIALDARRAERRAEDERRAAERLYPERKQ